MEQQLASASYAQLNGFLARLWRLPGRHWVVFGLGWLSYVAVLARAHGWEVRGAQMCTELPLVLALYAVGALLLRRSRLSPFVAAVPVLLVYVAHDLYLWMFDSVPDWQTVALVPELWTVAAWYEASIGLVLLAGPVLVWLALLDLAALRSRRALVLVPVGLVLGLVLFAPAVTASAARAEVELWDFSEVTNLTHYGRLFISLERLAEHRAMRAQLDRHAPVEATSLYVPPDELAQVRRRNVHLIVMESFLDARALTKVLLSRPAFADDFAALVGESGSASLSPLFGNGTAKSELEVLCGVRAFGWFGEEANAFTGARVPCLPAILGAAGWDTVAHHPFRPTMYNRSRFYPGLGFAHSLFDERFTSERPAIAAGTAKGKQFLFDGVLFPQVLSAVRQHVEQHQPMLDYVLTIWGHHPPKLERDQPVVVQVTPADARLETLVNQTYYRTQALASFLRQLMQLDPDGLIVAVGDHLPPLPEGAGRYDELGLVGRLSAAGDERLHETFLLVIDRGQVVPVGLHHHYGLRDLVLDRLTDGAHCRQHACEGSPARLEPPSAEQERAYTTLMALALGQ